MMSRRFIMPVALFLLLGAIVNVAVAWLLLAGDVKSAVPSVTVIQSNKVWTVWRHSATGHIHLVRGRGIDRGQNVLPERLPRGWPVLSGSMFNSSDALWSADVTGWPMLALWCDRVKRASQAPMCGGSLDLGLPTYTNGYPRVLPLRPVWPGFAINTVFYAAALWLLFAAPFALRRRRRIKRGLCPKCAYPVGTNQVCTECGTVVLPLMIGAAV